MPDRRRDLRVCTWADRDWNWNGYWSGDSGRKGGEQEMTDEQLVTKYLKAAHELAMLPHGIGWTPEVGRRREELERQVETMRPQIDGLHRKYGK